MKIMFFIIIGIVAFATIMIPLNFSVEKDDLTSYLLWCTHLVFSDYKRCELLWNESENSENTTAIHDSVTEPSTLPNGSLDSDGDKIPDHLDECPNSPENFDGYRDYDGCTDDMESFERCIQSGGRIWPNESGCTDEYGAHFISYELVKQRCVEQGSKWTWGEIEFCRMPAGDEGVTCTDSSECEDICRTDTYDGDAGICTTFSGGCDYVLEDGDIHVICG